MIKCFIFACIQTSHAMASALNAVQTSHAYGDLMLLMKASELKEVCISLCIYVWFANIETFLCLLWL